MRDGDCHQSFRRAAVRSIGGGRLLHILIAAWVLLAVAVCAIVVVGFLIDAVR
jgi:hypothetical protein